jgi:alkylation response protein AidB-like acyl-CoA dehydrogenase
VGDVALHDRIEKLDRLTTTVFRERAMRDEAEGRFPLENLRAIHDLGLLHVTAEPENGGYGGHLLGERPELFLDVLRRISRGDAATAHCYQLHNHTLWTLEGVGTPEQKERFVRPLTSRFGISASVGSEPGRVNMYEMKTKARRVDGGWIVNGVKNFVTNGEYSDIVIVVVAVEGVTDPIEGHMMVVLEPGMAGQSWDDDWYQPNGMRIARSPLLTLKDVFVPDSHVLGAPGTYPKQRWQGRFHLGFAANYLGSAEGLFDWFVDYAKGRGRIANPLVQLRTGEMRMQIDAARALFEKAVHSWKDGKIVEAELISMSAKTTAAHAALAIARGVLYSAGASAQFDEHPFGYFVRNIEMHCVHAGHDRTAQIIGQAALGETFDSTLQR